MPLTKEQISQIKLTFLTKDRDCTGEQAGAIDAMQLEEIVKAMGLSIPSGVVEEQVRIFDDGDGDIQYDEFLSVIESLLEKYEPKTNEVKSAFDVFTEGKKTMTEDELADALSQYGYCKSRQEALTTIRAAGFDGDIEKFLGGRLIAQ
eukprot:TRINITY_DN681_c0_g1_i1.p3 TRINITY_DN681_c0_g1~~TRINITY_DN681_c0_g1_i1.p3  ORF type:complete len:148 (+),score=77.62 TRINITY_DN681_c0_g1_i1:71-514(+)